MQEPPSGNSETIEAELHARIAALLAPLGCELAGVERVAPGLGARRFYRLLLVGDGPRRAIARIEAPEDDTLRPTGVAPEPPLEPLRSFLEAAGIPVARQLASEASSGIEILEDLGDSSLETLAASVSEPERRRLYAEACAIAVRLQQLRASPGEIPAFGRRLDEALFRYKADQVVEWLLPWSQGRETSASEAAVVREAFAHIADASRAAPQRLSHRDYKAANLHLHDGRLVLIDLQGALLAPPEYDFVCLLRDSHVPLPDDEVDEQLEKVRPALPDAPSPDEFERRFTLLTLSRVGKDLSRYLYAARERGDERYLRLLPESSRLLRRAADRSASWHPKLARLAELFSALPERSEPRR